MTVMKRRGGASPLCSGPVTVDGLGSRGGGAHAPHEFVLAARARVALAVTAAALSD